MARLPLCTLAAIACVFAQDPGESFRAGSKAFAEGRLDAALSAFQEALRVNPRYGPAWKAIGVLLASRGEIEGAETPFRNACEFQPALSDACLYFGRTLYLLNRFPQAVEVLRRVSRREPQNAEAHRLLGLSLEGQGDNAAAGEELRLAMRVAATGPANEDPGIDFGVLLFRQGRAEDAIVPLQDVLKRHPDAGRAHLELGCVLLALDRVTDAAASLERAVALDAGNSRAHLLLGKAYLRLGKNDAAEEQLRQGSRTVR
jgi:Flp pilus assembly protein TadD